MAGLVFLGVFIVSVILALGSFLFGHDADHDGGDHGDHGGMPSVFSLRVISLFLVGFSGVGMVSFYAWNLSAGASTGIGALFGLILGGVGYGFIALFHKQQANSMVQPNEYVGLTGRISGSIPAGGTGQISVTVNNQLRTIFAVTADGSALPEGRMAKVLSVSGGTATVQAA